MNGRSIEVRLTLWYTLLIVAAAAIFGAYTYFSLERRLYEEIQSMLSQRIVHLREDVLPDVANSSPDALAHKIQDIYSPEQNDRFIRISKSDGTILYVSGVPRERTFDPSRIPLPHGYTLEASEQLRDLRDSQHILLVGLTTDVGGADYVVEMGTAITPVEIALRKLIVTLLIGLPVIVIIAAVGGLLLVRRALRPVEEMRATAEQISFGKLRQRLPLGRSDDAIDQLAKTLNQMLERLDQAYQQASRFSADASHELRTPLTIMRSELETMLQNQDLVPLLRERLGSALEETERLSNIVEGLFAIARLDAGEAKIEHKSFNLTTLVRSTIDQMQLLAEEKHQSVTIHVEQPVIVAGDAARIKQVIVNLLDNAIKYTMAGGLIAFSVKAQSSKAILAVEDNGLGVSPEALPHVFERFYRADKVRSRSLQGAGLGLSIVQAICLAHGGTVEISSTEGAGTKVTVELPLIDIAAEEKSYVGR